MIKYEDFQFGVMELTIEHLKEVLHANDITVTRNELRLIKSMFDKVEFLSVYNLVTDSEIVKIRKRIIRYINKNLR